MGDWLDDMRRAYELDQRMRDDSPRREKLIVEAYKLAYRLDAQGVDVTSWHDLVERLEHVW